MVISYNYYSYYNILKKYDEQKNWCSALKLCYPRVFVILMWGDTLISLSSLRFYRRRRKFVWRPYFRLVKVQDVATLLWVWLLCVLKIEQLVWKIKWKFFSRYHWLWNHIVVSALSTSRPIEHVCRYRVWLKWQRKRSEKAI